jgi:DUF2971 family protein
MGRRWQITQERQICRTDRSQVTPSGRILCMSIAQLADELYVEQPAEVLYHYTSLGALAEIVASGCLYATDIRFFSDAAEMKHAADILGIYIAQRIEAHATNSRLFSQFRQWVLERLTGGHMQFVVSFTENGNLLSQWRSYCPHGKGVSIGFAPELLTRAATAQGFHVGKCIYDNEAQRSLMESILTDIESLAETRGENTDPSKRHPSQSFHDVFEEVENDLLRIAALLKHGAFSEEEEWRAVSPITRNYVHAPIKYREGRTMLIPYIEFSLRGDVSSRLPLDHVYLGPTPSANNSMTSLSRFLSKYGANPMHGVTYCQIPYREH